MTLDTLRPAAAPAGPTRRRILLAALGAASAGAGAGLAAALRGSVHPALAQPATVPPALATPIVSDADPRLAVRALGPADAKVTVLEFFSHTCSHCAAFQRETFPRVRSELIDTGRVRYVFQDFPTDRAALMASMVARSLPAERYEPFVSMLLAGQDRWAFARGVSPTEELAKAAALAGMTRQHFDAVLADAGLKHAILAVQDEADRRYNIRSVPTFVVQGRIIPGALSYDALLQMVEAAA